MFESRRFLRLAAVHWAEHGRAILWFLGIGIAVHFCVWLLFTRGGSAREVYSQDTQIFVYMVGYMLTGLLFAGRHFAALSERGAGLSLLMQPASNFEKFLLAFLMVALFYPLTYTLAFQVCNVPAALLGEAARDILLAAQDDGADGVPMAAYLANQAYGPYVPLAGGRGEAAWEVNLWLGVIAMQALVVVGTLYFRRLAWLKTVVALFVLLVLVVPLLSMLTGASIDRLFLDTWQPGASGWIRAWIVTLWIGMPALFWASAFFFLRERELS